MSVYEWNELYTVHIAALDRQHQRLFAAIHQLDEALSSGQGSAVVEDVLKQLMNYTASHFAAEEKLMERYGFAGLAEHKSKHEELTRKVLALQEEYRRGNIGVPVSLMLFLQAWLKEHILGTDKQYSEFLNAKGVH